MSPAALKGSGIACSVVCVILLFIAWDRYQDNANKVDAITKVAGPWAALAPMYGINVEPGTPEATKYSLFFAALTAIGGIVCMVMGTKTATSKPSQTTSPPDLEL